MAVDRIVEREGREAPCRTHEIPLGMPAAPGELRQVEGVDEESLRHLAGRYGHAAVEVLEMAASDPRLARRITPELPDLMAEVPIAARLEQTRSLADVMLRRTRLGLLDARRLSEPGAEATETMATILGEELGWDESKRAEQIEIWHRVAAAEGLVPGAAAAAERAAERV